jgi:hypothetical protein
VTQPTLEPSLPSEAEAILAKETSRVLAARLREDEPLRLCISDDPSPEGTLNLPASVCGYSYEYLKRWRGEMPSRLSWFIRN